jgi:hypothetical protein
MTEGNNPTDRSKLGQAKKQILTPKKKEYHYLLLQHQQQALKI